MAGCPSRSVKYFCTIDHILSAACECCTALPPTAMGVPVD